MNAPMHAPLNTTNEPMYASSSLVKDGGATAPTALLLLAATAAPVETSTAVADAQPPLPTTPPPTTPPTAMATAMPRATATPATSFVKLNLI